MANIAHRAEERPLALADLLRLLYTKRRAIFATAWTCAAVAALFALSRPISYQAEGTFRDRGLSTNGLKNGTGTNNNGLLSAMLSGMGATGDQELVSLFKSRRLSAPVIEQLGLQVLIVEQTPSWGLLGRLWDNAYAEWAHLWRLDTPVIRVPEERLLISNVHYPGEIPLSYRLHFESPTQYRLESSEGKWVGTGHLDQSFVSEEIQFLVQAATQQNLEGALFHLEASPLGPLAKQLARRMKIKPAEEREKVQKITFHYPDRQRVSRFVNELMVAYQDYAQSENRRQSNSQLEYLQTRQNASFADLQAFMTEHAAAVSKDLTSTGIFDTEKELDYLLRERLECCTKLTEGDLEIRRLQAVDAEESGDYRALAAANGLPQPIVEALAQIRELTRRRDLLKVALEEAPFPGRTDPPPSLQGVDLKTAEEIFVSLNSQRNQIESEIKQNRFILDQLTDPAFEISSLAGALTDPVSREIIAKASTAVLNLHDSGNRSEREQERLRESLSQQRSFLTAHLVQSNELLLLRQQFLNEKTTALQKVLYELIQQQLAITEQHLRDYLHARMTHLKNEQSLLEQTLLELRQQMALLPMRWASEQMVLQRLKLNKTLVDEVGKFVESKNISSNLETIQSGPIDLALPPILPQPPYVLLFALLGGALGSLVSSGIVVTRGLRYGLQASLQNLRLEGQQVAGTLTRQGPQWIDLLRRICSQLDIHHGDDLLLLTGHGPDYSLELAQLLAKRSLKVLRLSIASQGNTDPRALPGILQVLEGHAAQPRICAAANSACDEVVFGGESPYLCEWLQSEKFSVLLKELHQSYAVILLVLPAVADSAEAASLAARFPKVAVTVALERLQDLLPLFQHPALSFVLTEGT